MDDSQSENQAFISQLADKICRWGLQVPVLVGLEAGRPFAFLGGQLLWVAKPALAVFLSGNTVSRMAELLEEPAGVEALIATLEARESL
ncbi:MAG: hypothetical protein WAM60_14200 [Candidatus Promineifilaceae bacterium]